MDLGTPKFCTWAFKVGKEFGVGEGVWTEGLEGYEGVGVPGCNLV